MGVSRAYLCVMTIAVTTDYGQAIAAEVRAMTARKSLRHKEIAAALGKSEMYVSRRMTGHNDWTAAELYSLASVLGCGVADLLPTDPTGPGAPPSGDFHRRELVGITGGKSSRLMAVPAIRDLAHAA